MALDGAALQAVLVKKLRSDRTLTDRRVEAAFRAVPRHLFLPGLPLDEVYRDEAIPTKFEAGQPVSSSSQPAMMAIMLEQLAVTPGQHVLEIGAGTGYNAALLGHLVGPTGQVVTVDIDSDLALRAEANLKAAGVKNAAVICADGGRGHAASAPYDRVILTVGAWDVAPAWISQLALSGRMVLPLALGGGWQKSIAFQPPGQPTLAGPLLESVSVRDCGFMRLRGEFAGPDRILPLGHDSGLSISIRADLPAPQEVILGWLCASAGDRPTGLEVSRRDFWEGLGFWLDVHVPNMCEVAAEGNSPAHVPAPHLIEFQGKQNMRVSLGVLGSQGLCLMWISDDPWTGEDIADKRGPLILRSFGSDAAEDLADRLTLQTGRWMAAGRPTAAGMRVRVYPGAPRVEAGNHQIRLAKSCNQFLIDWPKAAR